MSDDDLMELLTRQEALDDELKPWVTEEGAFGPMLKHPLVFEIMFDATRCARVNAMLRQKKEMLAKAKADENWLSYIYLHERPYRIDAFRDISWQLADTDYWKLLGNVWVDSENIWQNREEWREMLEADEYGREAMSTEDVRCVFTLPPEKGGLLDETVIYRGYRDEDGLEGFSWTLDKARAKWFARRLAHRGETALVAEGRVKREHVIAYITERDEQEIVVMPEHVNVIGVTEVEGE